jgi:serine/threonine protein phosphatase PrpC
MVSAQSYSETGGHLENEDAFAVQQHPLDPNLWLCFVADGQGGRSGGGAAARLACRAAVDLAVRWPPDRLANPAVWSSILESADEAVEADPVAEFTTLVGLAASRDRVVGASCGDSAALLMSAARVVELTAGQRKNPPVGSGSAVAVQFAATLSSGWQLLGMSDGVWKYVGWDRIVVAARRVRGATLVAELQQMARMPVSGAFPDDFTVVVLEDQASGAA